MSNIINSAAKALLSLGTRLSIDSITDGQFLKRSGSTIISEAIFSTQADVDAGTSNTVAITPLTNAQSVPIQGRRTMEYYHNAAFTTVTAIGCSAPVTLSGVANYDDLTSDWLGHDTIAAIGDTQGLVGGTNTGLMQDWKPFFSIKMQTGSSIANVRLWFGLFTGDPSGSATPATNYFAFRYDTGADGTAFWRCCNDNASGTPNVITTTQSIAANTIYNLRFYFNGTKIYYYINDVEVGVTISTLPTSGAVMYPRFRITALAAAIKTMKWTRCSFGH